jgi:acyl transferase domain-containing protein/acyl carrier protein
LAQAGIAPTQVGYIEAHGTGTALGDPIEIAGLLQAFEREPLPRGACPIGSVKSNIGHCESAAGIAGLSKVLLQMRHGRIAPSLHSDVLNPAIDFAASPFFVPQTLLPWPRPVEDTLAGPRERPRIAGISSFGAGGANAHVIVAEHLPSPRATESPGGPQAILLSARTRAALEARARDLLSAIERGHRVTGDFDAIVCTLQLGREAMAWRAGFVAADLDALAAGLRDLLAGSARIRFGEVRADSAPATIDAHDLDRNDPAALVAAWVDGADVPWRALRGTRPVRRVPLPTYPFERTVYWADVARIPVLPGFASPSPASAAASASHTAPDRALVRSWRPSPLPAVAPFAAGQVFVLATPALADVCAALALRAPGLRVRSLMHGGDADFLDADACEPLLDRFDVAADVPVALLDLTALDTDYEAEVAPECGKWRLLQGFVEHHARSGALVVQATCGLADARGGVPTLQGARTVGLYRALGAEYGRLRVCSVDLDPAESAAEARAGRLLVELGALASGASADSDVCLHGERRLVAAFEARPLPAAPPPRDDVVLITGGTGGIGSALAAHLVAAGTRAVAVIGREPLPPPADWPSALRDDPDPARRARLRRLQALVDAGARVRHACVPLSDAAALADEIAAIEAAFGPIATVYHCAGSGGATPAFVKKPIDEMRAVVMPKTVGLRALEAAFADRQAPRFVLCASVSGAVPALGAGQVDYAMANAYLDHVVARRRALGHSGDRAVQWPLWREVGMAVDATPSPAYRRSGLPSLDTPDGLRLFDAVLACDAGVLMPIGRADVDPQALLHPVSSPIATPAVSASAAPAASVVRSRRPAIAAWLRSVFVAEFGLPEAELQESRPFVDYGVDSIFVVQAVTRMQRESGRTIDPALLFEHDTLGRLADHLDADATFDPAFLTEVPHDTASVPQTPAVEIMASPVAAAAATGDAFADPQAHAAIAVVGLACRLPGARDREAYWRLLADGVSAIGPVPAGRWQVSEPGRYLGGWVEDVERFDPEFFGLHPDDARVMDPQARLVLEEALAALCDAGYRREDVSGARAGVYIGGRARLDATALDAVFAAPNPILGIGQNYLATNVSRLFNLTGPSLVVDTACSSGVTGIALAVDALRAGQIDLALAGAVSLLQDPVAHDLFAARNILSPDGRFRLFERQAGGEVLGEGAGLVVLKRLADAQRDGDHVRAVIRAIALNNDGRTLGPGSPNLAAQRNVLRQALEQAGATAADVGYIEVNGGGSPVTDSIEIKALSEVYGLQDRSLGPCHVGSIKPNVSHLLLTSGIASFIRCVLSLEHRRIPPFLSAHDPFAFYDFASSRIVFDRAVTDWDVPSGKRRLAAMSSFADGGTNCHVLIEEAPPAATARASLPLPPMQRRSMVPIVHAGSVSAPRQLPAEKREEARGEPSVVAMENFWGRYVDTTV